MSVLQDDILTSQDMSVLQNDILEKQDMSILQYINCNMKQQQNIIMKSISATIKYDK